MTKEELKQEAEKYAEKHAFRVPYDGSNKFYDDVDYKASVDGYLAGAEPREKRIEELEETCNKWFEHLKNREEELLNELNNQNSKYNKQIEELEKENAELKQYNKYLRRKRQGGIQKQYNKVAIIKQQNNLLTKAKKIIKKVFTEYSLETIGDKDVISFSLKHSEYEKLKNQIDQFLKDSKVEK